MLATRRGAGGDRIPWERRLVIAGVALAVAGCAGHDWQQAQRANTGSAYRAFVTANRDHRKVDVAMQRAEALDWERARQLDTPDAYLAYLGAHRVGAHAAEALAAAERRAWQTATSENTPESLSAFVVRFPQSAQRAEAEDRLEAAWFERARAEGTEEAWSRYLVRYPQGEFGDVAKAERERIAWETTQRVNTREAYARFATGHPTSPFRDAALAWIEQSRVTVLQPVVMLGASWVARDQRPDLARSVRRQLTDALLADLRSDFRIRRTVLVDLQGGPAPQPQQAFGIQSDTGLLVLTYRDALGRAFQPSGRATDIHAELALYAPPTAAPVWSVQFDATTPGITSGRTEATLREAALFDLGSRLRGFAEELANERRGVP